MCKLSKYIDMNKLEMSHEWNFMINDDLPQLPLAFDLFNLYATIVLFDSASEEVLINSPKSIVYEKFYNKIQNFYTYIDQLDYDLDCDAINLQIYNDDNGEGGCYNFKDVYNTAFQLARNIVQNALITEW